MENRDRELSMKEIRYQVIEWDERYWIVDEGTLLAEKKITPNLIDGEVKVIRLSVQDCPLKVNCIELEGEPGEEVCSICKYLGNYHYLRTTVPCHYGGYSERDLLKILPDPFSVKAKYARVFFSPAGNPVKKSHAHLVCDRSDRS
ncbi:MAG: hypothetical protein MUC98_00610 [Desulfobacterota bacterium]|nr:hypothetical protein [Thermodesulfobacteriota bacterium]